MTIGILCAVPEETKAFGAQLLINETQRRGGLDFHRARLAGHDVIVVECGIGKVNAAFASTILCEIYECQILLFSGIAGGLDPALSVGDVVIGSRVLQVDYGKFQSGQIIPYRPGIPPLAPPSGEIGYLLSHHMQEKLMPLLNEQLETWDGRAPKIQFGTIATADTFLNDEKKRQQLFADHQAQAIEMEGAAICQVAESYGAQTIIIRALSDLAGDESDTDFVKFGAFAAHAAAQLVVSTIRLLNT